VCTHDLHAVPEREAERVHARPCVETLDAPDRAERDREANGAPVDAREREVWRQEVQLAGLGTRSLGSAGALVNGADGARTHIRILLALHTEGQHGVDLHLLFSLARKR
jgi:hypothetical protein